MLEKEPSTEARRAFTLIGCGVLGALICAPAGYFVAGSIVASQGGDTGAFLAAALIGAPAGGLVGAAAGAAVWAVTFRRMFSRPK